MNEENNIKEVQKSDTELITELKNEYEKKIAELEAKHKEEIEKVRKEERDHSLEQLKAIISGRQDISTPKEENKEKSFFDIALEECRNSL